MYIDSLCLLEYGLFSVFLLDVVGAAGLTTLGRLSGDLSAGAEAILGRDADVSAEEPARATAGIALGVSSTSSPSITSASLPIISRILLSISFSFAAVPPSAPVALDLSSLTCEISVNTYK
uniref:Uncharacterized protein n=1 Tax=Cacopsylla melanoneura TaxID=428564 RepID=A0A8D8VJ48_9HEMI